MEHAGRGHEWLRGRARWWRNSKRSCLAGSADDVAPSRRGRRAGELTVRCAVAARVPSAHFNSIAARYRSAARSLGRWSAAARACALSLCVARCRSTTGHCTAETQCTGRIDCARKIAANDFCAAGGCLSRIRAALRVRPALCTPRLSAYPRSRPIPSIITRRLRCARTRPMAQYNVGPPAIGLYDRPSADGHQWPLGSS